MLCPDCDGSGRYQRDAMKLDGISYPAVDCDCEECDGTGQICDHCYEPETHCGCDIQDVRVTERE